MIKWEDTVMGATKIEKVSSMSRYDKSSFKKVAQAQAKISFKAGEETERAKHELSYCEKHKLYYCDCCPDCFEEKGRREVVEWVNANPMFIQNKLLGIKVPVAASPEWQAQIKEWGL